MSEISQNYTDEILLKIPKFRNCIRLRRHQDPAPSVSARRSSPGTWTGSSLLSWKYKKVFYKDEKKTEDRSVWIFLCLLNKGSIFLIGELLYNRVSQNELFSVKHSMTVGKRKLEWCRVPKYIYIFLKFCSSHERAIVKNIFADFRKFYYSTQHFLRIYVIFHILTQPKNPRFFFYNFQRHSYNICAPSVSAHAHNAMFVIWVWVLLSRIVDEIENRHPIVHICFISSDWRCSVIRVHVWLKKMHI